MKKYDLLVIGSGSGLTLVEEGVEHGLKVALVDKGPFGGTCLNVGCIPSKMLIHPADRIMEIKEARKLGVTAEVNNIDFKAIMTRMRHNIQESRQHMQEGIAAEKRLDFYEGEGHFIADYTMEAAGKKIKAENVVIASGSRPFIPPIKGIDTVDYLTNESLLGLQEKPESMIIIGGGYVAVEYGHFFAAMGTKVIMLELADRLILSEEPEIAELLKQKLGERMAIHTGTQAEEVKQQKGRVTVVAKDKKTGARKEFRAESLLMAVGRRSNADLLKVENTGVKTDEKGFVRVNDYLETSKANIYACGDANGQQMFTHMANREAQLLVHRIMHGHKAKVDYSAAPHAVYSYPQIASVGLTEAQAKEKHKVLVGKATYFSVAWGEAMREVDGFAKAIVDKKTEKILGFHIIGPHAPILIQEVINAMASGGHIGEIQSGLHIHPALPELIQVTLGNLAES